MIIGRPGSGKTVFSEKLEKLTGRKVTHLDKYYWKPDWVKAHTSEGFKEKVSELAAGDEWIIDGDFRSSIDVRLDKADAVVFFDFPAWKSVYGVYKRRFFGDKDIVNVHPGMIDRVSLKLLQAIVSYDTKRVYKMLSETKGKKIFIIKSREEGRKVLDEVVYIKPERGLHRT